MVEHPDRDSLALVALDEPVSSAIAAHIRDCRPCADELTGLREITSRARCVVAADRTLPAVPGRLWERIHMLTADPSSSGLPARPARSVRAKGPGTAPPGEDPPTVTALPRDRRTVAVAWLSAAAALVVVVAVAGGVLLAGEPAVLAQVVLEPLDGRAGPTAARLVADDGRPALEIEDTGLPDADGYYAVWLIDEDVEGMVSVGPLEAGGRHRLPDGIDLDAFPILDVSLEPFDGDPTHSGDSVLRAVLDG